MGTGVIGGVVGGVAAGTRAGRAAAISAFELTPTPEGETAISQAIPTGLAAQVGGAVGARQGAVTGGALGAALTAQLFPGPQPEVTLAPGVEVPLPVAGGVLGAAVGGVEGDGLTEYTQVGGLSARVCVCGAGGGVERGLGARWVAVVVGGLEGEGSEGACCMVARGS